MHPRGLTLMGSIDTQDDRYEGRVWAFGLGEEAWLVDKWVLMGDPASEELRKKVRLKVRQQYVRGDGAKMGVERWCWDSGGHYTDEVYAESRALGDTWVIPVKGANVPGKPIANWPKSRNAKKVYLTEVGTENAKELIYSRLKIQPNTSGVPVPGCVHFPANDDICGEDELKQLTAETKELKIEKGRRVYRWTAKGRRNEALDCFVYALGEGAIVDLAPGEEPMVANPARPNAQFDPFFSAIVKEIGAALELPLEELMLHYSSSYSAARAAMLQAWRFYTMRRWWLVCDFCQPSYELMFDEAVAAGRIRAPGYRDPALRRAYTQAIWIGPARGAIDELKEAKAARERIDVGISNETMETAAMSGETWQQVNRQRARELKQRRDNGTTPATVAAAPKPLVPEPEPPEDEE